LNVAFLHDVEQAYLNFSGEIRELVHGEDSAVRARQKAVVNCKFVAQVASRASCFDGVHVAEDVCNRDVRRGEFFHEARVARQPSNRRGVAAFGNQVLAGAAQRREWLS